MALGAMSALGMAALAVLVARLTRTLGLVVGSFAIRRAGTSLTEEGDTNGF